jgi:uncharacterized protein
MAGLEFEWDEAKATSNLEKRGVSFQDAKTVFNDEFSITIADLEHSDDEVRWIDLGLSAQGRLLVVVYTDCETRIRLISARVATSREQNTYAEQI